MVGQVDAGPAPPVGAGPVLSSGLRVLLLASAAAYVVVGLPLFVAPGWASERFAWRVSPFVAMTAGGWCLGTAAFAAYGVWRRSWPAARPCVVYVFAFGVSQLGVALYERDLLRTGELLTWPYLTGLCLSVVSGGVALVEGRSHFAPDRRPGMPMTPVLRVLAVGFVALVFLLAAVAFAAPPRSTKAAVFPEALSLFSLRAFGVFYLSLGVAMLVLVADRRAEAYCAYMRPGLVLIGLILAATAVYAGSFDIGEHPLQVLYPAAYLVALLGAVYSLGWERREPA